MCGFPGSAEDILCETYASRPRPPCPSVRPSEFSASLSSCVPGFKEQIYDVYRYLPPATQVVLISATLPHEILEMTNKFMTDPIRILVKR